MSRAETTSSVVSDSCPGEAKPGVLENSFYRKRCSAFKRLFFFSSHKKWPSTPDVDFCKSHKLQLLDISSIYSLCRSEFVDEKTKPQMQLDFTWLESNQLRMFFFTVFGMTIQPIQWPRERNSNSTDDNTLVILFCNSVEYEQDHSHVMLIKTPTD